MLKIFVGKGKMIRQTLFAADARDAKAKQRAISAYKEAAAKADQNLITETSAKHRNECFLDFFARLCETKKPTTRKAWHLTLRHLRLWRNGEPLKFKDVDKVVVRSYRDYLQRLIDKGDLSANGANVYWWKFKAALNEATALDVIPSNPAAAFKAFPSEETETAFLTIAELQRLAATPPPKVRGYDSETFKTFLLFLAKTGARPGDAKAFTWRMIQGDLNGGFFIDYRPSKTRRKGVGLTRLWLHPDAITLLQKHRERQINFSLDAPIFVGLPEPNKNVLNKFLRVWAKQAGIEKHLTIYSMRHTHASNLLESGVDLYAISKVLAHTSTAHTQRYAHLLDAEKKRAVLSLPSIFGENGSANL